MDVNAREASERERKRGEKHEMYTNFRYFLPFQLRATAKVGTWLLFMPVLRLINSECVRAAFFLLLLLLLLCRRRCCYEHFASAIHPNNAKDNLKRTENC